MRRGSLQLSVGAIITLIIAVALLGLVVSFVATQFGAFSSKITLTEPTPNPTAANPITIPGGSSSLDLKKNNDYEMVVKVYNSDENPLEISSTEILSDDEIPVCADVTGSGASSDAMCLALGCLDAAGCTGRSNVACTSIRESSSFSGFTLTYGGTTLEEAGKNWQCALIGCGDSDALGFCTPSGDVTKFQIRCADPNVASGLTFELPATTIGAGSTGEFSALLSVDSNVPVKRTSCTWQIGDETIPLYINIE